MIQSRIVREKKTQTGLHYYPIEIHGYKLGAVIARKVAVEYDEFLCNKDYGFNGHISLRFPQVKDFFYETIIKENQWMKLPPLQNLGIWYPLSDMELSLKSLENSFVNYTTFNWRELTLIDAIRVSLGWLN